MPAKHLAILLMALPACADTTAPKQPDPGAADNPNLPRVLVIGDSISMNYHGAAKSALAGAANYHRIEGNCFNTDHGVKNIGQWLGNHREKGLQWDVIQFNHGLHDLKQSYDAKTGVWGGHAVSLEDYKRNLEKEIAIMRETGARLIWCSTTPVPNDNKGAYARRKGESKVFNDAAMEIIRRHPDILVTDLHAVVDASPVFDNWRKGNDVHFYKPEEQKLLGEAVAATVRKALEKPAKKLPLPGETFMVDGHVAFLMMPPERDASKPTPWVWYAPTLPKLPGNEERWMFERLLANGVAVAGIDVGESMGNPAGRALFTAFHREMTGKRGMSPKPCLLARSRGGLMHYNWAVENPQSLAAIAGIYPVGNLASWPGLAKANSAYGMTVDGLAAQLTNHNPVDRLAPLAKAGVPIMHLHGDKDGTVPLDQNSGLLKQRYDQLGGTMTLEVVKGGGHDMNPHWFQSQTLVDFVILHAKGAKPAGFTWSSAVPADCPFPKSPTLTGIRFTGRHSDYHCGDTFYPSWASDGNLYSPWTDGVTDGVNSGSGDKLKRGATTGHAVMTGDDPLRLSIKNTSPPKEAWAKPYRGRYPCGSLVHDGIWYYGTYCLGSSGTVDHRGFKWNWPNLGPMPGFQISRDLGRTWEPSPLSPDKPLFPEPEKFLGPVKMGAPHFVDFGKNMEHSPDGRAYLLGMGAEKNDPHPRPCIKPGPPGKAYELDPGCTDDFAHGNLSWISADQVYLTRVKPSPETINDIKAYEFFAGNDQNGKPLWTPDFARIKPLLEWNNHMGCVTATWVPGLEKYLMCVTDGWPTVAKMNSYILEADDLTGPWRMVAYLKDFGEQAYFLNFPSKFISTDGRTLWLCYSANFSPGWNGVELGINPPGGRYGLSLHEIQLTGPTP